MVDYQNNKKKRSFMNLEARTILDKALEIYSGKIDWKKSDFKWAQGFTERAIETTWLSERLIDAKPGDALLDIGFSLSSLDTLGLWLEIQKKGINFTALDIISPERVLNRYPEEWKPEILKIPFLQGDVLEYKFSGEKFDWITCISTLEHVGFDEVSGNNESAFKCVKDISKVILNRSPGVTDLFLKQVSGVLNVGGKLLLTLPFGADQARVLRDSLGCFRTFWEYGQESILEISSFTDFKLHDAHYFYLNNESIWTECNKEKAENVKNSIFKPSTDSCVLLELEKIK